MTLRLEDDDERISNLAKLFFHELSKKGIAYNINEFFIHPHIFFTTWTGFCSYKFLILIPLSTGANPIYNLLPDILGKLCNQNLPRESFCNIMQFLIGSIKRVCKFNWENLTNIFLKLTTYYVLSKNYAK